MLKPGQLPIALYSHTSDMKGRMFSKSNLQTDVELSATAFLYKKLCQT